MGIKRDHYFGIALAAFSAAVVAAGAIYVWSMGGFATKTTGQTITIDGYTAKDCRKLIAEILLATPYAKFIVNGKPQTVSAQDSTAVLCPPAASKITVIID